MTISTYDELLVAIPRWFKRDSEASLFPDFIRLAEADLNRRLHTRHQEATASLSAASAYTALPTGFQSFRWLKDATGTPLQYRTPDALFGYPASTDGPAYYTISGGSIWWWPVPSDAATITAIYRQSLDLGTTSTNAVLTNHPDLYLFAVLAQAEAFLQADERATVWLQAREAAIAAANLADIKQRTSGSPLEPAGQTYRE